MCPFALLMRGMSSCLLFATIHLGTRYPDKVEAAVKAALKRKVWAARHICTGTHRRGCHVGLAPAPALRPPHCQSHWLVRVQHTYTHSGWPVFDETLVLAGIRGRGQLMGRRMVSVFQAQMVKGA